MQFYQAMFIFLANFGVIFVDISRTQIDISICKLLKLLEGSLKPIKDLYFYFCSTLLIATMIIISGTFFYSSVEGWSVVDALYFCMMTLTTIGYGDLHPTRDLYQIFKSFYAIVGFGVFMALITQIAQAQIEKKITNENSPRQAAEYRSVG